MGVGVGESYLKTVTHPFFYVRLQCVVGGNARRFVALGFGGITNIGHTEVDITPFISIEVRTLPIGQLDGTIVRIHNLVAVRILLPIDGMAGGGNLGLVEWHRNDQVTPKVSEVADLN